LRYKKKPKKKRKEEKRDGGGGCVVLGVCIFKIKVADLGGEIKTKKRKEEEREEEEIGSVVSCGSDLCLCVHIQNKIRARTLD